MELLPSTRGRAALALALLAPLPTLGVFFAMIFEPTRGMPIGQAAYALSKIWILLFPLFWTWLFDGRNYRGLGWSAKGIGFGVALGAVIALAILATYWLFSETLIDPALAREAAQRNGIGTPQRFVLLALYLTFINSLLEEYVWRWFVLRQCETLVGGRAAVIASALLFTLHHVLALKSQMNWGTTLLASLGIFLGGCAWSWCYLRFRSIWPGFVSHVIVDAAVLVIGWHLLFGLP